LQAHERPIGEKQAVRMQMDFVITFDVMFLLSVVYAWYPMGVFLHPDRFYEL
jgi:hypothetical protein